MDAGGSINRRMFMIEFNHMVPTDAMETQLFDNMKKSIGSFLLKANTWYLMKAHKYGHKDLAAPNTLSDQILEFQNNLVFAVDALARFVNDRDSEGLVLSKDVGKEPDEVYIKYAEFLARYKTFRENNGYGGIKVDADHTMRVFEINRLKIIKDSRNYGQQMNVSARWIVGIGFKDYYDDSRDDMHTLDDARILF